MPTPPLPPTTAPSGHGMVLGAGRGRPRAGPAGERVRLFLDGEQMCDHAGDLWSSAAGQREVESSAASCSLPARSSGESDASPAGFLRRSGASAFLFKSHSRMHLLIYPFFSRLFPKEGRGNLHTAGTAAVLIRPLAKPTSLNTLG